MAPSCTEVQPPLVVSVATPMTSKGALVVNPPTVGHAVEPLLLAAVEAPVSKSYFPQEFGYVLDPLVAVNVVIAARFM